MRTTRLYLILALCITLISCSPANVKVACVGDSITYGHGISNREHDAYPAVLGDMLGEKFEVKNFGVSGRTLMNSSDMPYMSESVYKEALAFNPDIVTIKLGTNDSKPYNWLHKENFKSDLITLINSFQTLPSKPNIFLCLPAPAMGNAWNISDSVIFYGVIPIIKEVAKEKRLNVIDLYSPLKAHPDFFSDTIHPNEEGSRQIARIIYQAITGKKENS